MRPIGKVLIYKCQCDCGNVMTCSGIHLRSGRRRSCGCQNYRRRGKDNPKWSGYKEIPGSYWGRVKKGAKSRNFEFDITLKYVWELFLKQNRKCALSGRVLIFSEIAIESSKQTASLDRIDSSKGYIESNVQWVHKIVNSIKMDLEENEFIKICKEIVDYNEEINKRFKE